MKRRPQILVLSFKPWARILARLLNVAGIQAKCGIEAEAFDMNPDLVLVEFEVGASVRAERSRRFRESH